MKKSVSPMDGYIVVELVWAIQTKFGRYTFVLMLTSAYNINDKLDIQRRQSEHQIVSVEAALLPKAAALLIYIVIDLPSSVPSQ
ncbi:hypothetical protein N7501_000200 [Penicillium viridicatum]|nr:hypothetical protein N7501_000200 [Penicillium viridicatum]